MSEETNHNLESKENLSLAAQVEALLFVSSSPVSPKQVADAIGISQRKAQKGLDDLKKLLRDRGIRLQLNRGRYQLTTAPEISHFVEEFLKLDATTRLTSAALETLAIIAYQQPVTRPLIDSIRGVNSDSVIRNLLSKGLIEEAGRSEGPGRPILYTTSPEFLQHFGLGSIADLPTLLLAGEQIIQPEENAHQPQLPLNTEILKE